MPLLKRLFKHTEHAFVAYARKASQKRNALIFSVVGMLLVVIFLPGFAVLERENMHRGSRLPGEYGVFQRHFGGLSRVQATIHESASKQTASKEALDAILATITPLYKEDEADLCRFYDGILTERPSQCEIPEYSNNIYCNCETIASNPKQVSIFWKDNEGENQRISQKDLCESPPVPTVFRNAELLTFKPTDAGVTSSPVFIQYQSLVLNFLGGSIRRNPIFLEFRNNALSLCQSTIIEQEEMRAFEDITASAMECFRRVSIDIFGPRFGKSENSSLEEVGLRALWAVAITGNTNGTQLAQAYNNASISTIDGSSAVIAWEASRQLVQSASFLTAQASAAGFGAARAQFASEGTIMSYGYAEVAQCVSKYVHQNRKAILRNVAPNVVGLIDLERDGTVDWDMQGILAGISYLKFQMQELQNQSIQFNAIFAYISKSVEPFNSTIVQLEQMNQIIVNRTAFASARTIAEEILQANVALGNFGFFVGDHLVVAQTYQNITGNVTEASFVASSIVNAVNNSFFQGQDAIHAMIQGVKTAQVAVKQLIPEELTLNGTIRPLPRGWGIDRFPCSRTTGLDPFREGDFDLPYRMKMLDRVSIYMNYFFTLPYFSDAVKDANCLDPHLITPLRNGIYLEALQSYPAVYQGINFPSFRKAEEMYMMMAENDQQQAIKAAKAEFITDGYFISADNPFAPIKLTSIDGQAFLNTSAGYRFVSQVGSAVASAAPTASLIVLQFTEVVKALASFGFWYRPAYGTHPLANSALSTEEILAIYQSAIEASQVNDISIAECISHNTDPVDMTGRPVLSCFLAWSGTKLPHELTLGRLIFSNTIPSSRETTARLLRVESQRTGGSNYHSDHQVFREKINSILNKEVSRNERERIHRKFESAAIEQFTRMWKKEIGSGFAPSEEFADHDLFFTLERSIPDMVDDATDPEVGLLIGGLICLMAYVCIVSANFTHVVYSQVRIACLGVIVIATATAASLGLSAFMGVKFIPTSGNVVPFLALGIGVDDLLVLLAAFRKAAVSIDSPQIILESALADAGPSITFTSLTNALAFLIASTTPVHVVQHFCFQMVLSIVMNYIFLMLFVVPLLYWNAIRISEAKPDIPKVCSQSTKKFSIGYFDSFFQKHLGTLLMSDYVRGLVIVVFSLSVALSIWQAFEVERAVLFSEVAAKGSYQFGFAIRLESDFTMYNGYLVTDSEDFPSAQNVILESTQALQNVSGVTDSPPIEIIFWLNSLLLTESTSLNDPVPVENFYPAFSNWLAAAGITFLPDLSCIDSRDRTTVSCYDIVGAFSTPPMPGANQHVKLVASRGMFYMHGLQHPSDFVTIITATRNSVDRISKQYSNRDDPGFRTFVFSYVHLFWEQFVHSYTDLFTIVGFCLLGIFIATFLFQFSLIISCVLCIVVFTVILQIYGLMPAMGLTLNAFSTVNLCFAVAMAVEFSAHVAHHFLIQAGDSRKDRIQKTLGFIGKPLFNGAASSILAILFVAGSRTAFIRDYYFFMFFVIIIASFLNGTILLPVFLSFFGPPTLDAHYNANEKKPDESDGKNSSCDERFAAKIDFSMRNSTSIELDDLISRDKKPEQITSS